jgi:hypothetical protein
MSFEILVKFEYDNFHTQWVKDGEPTGNFWWADGTHPSPDRSFSSFLFMFGWLFDTPKRAKKDKGAKQ